MKASQFVDKKISEGHKPEDILEAVQAQLSHYLPNPPAHTDGGQSCTVTGCPKEYICNTITGNCVPDL